MALFNSPRTRRLKADLEAIKSLTETSSVVEFQHFGDPPERYLITFKGNGLVRKSESEPVEMADVHRVEIRLGIDYPRSRPDLQWLTSIYHPNISAVGAVCLGGYSTNWVPSLGLGDLIEMLWEMVRYSNYDPKSAYNYAAGRWSDTQSEFDFPVDERNIRDQMTRTVGDNIIKFSEPRETGDPETSAPKKTEAPKPTTLSSESSESSESAPAEEDVMFIGDDTTPGPPPYRPAPAIPPPSAADEDILIIE